MCEHPISASGEDGEWRFPDPPPASMKRLIFFFLHFSGKRASTFGWDEDVEKFLSQLSMSPATAQRRSETLLCSPPCDLGPPVTLGTF